MGQRVSCEMFIKLSLGIFGDPSSHTHIQEPRPIHTQHLPALLLLSLVSDCRHSYVPKKLYMSPVIIRDGIQTCMSMQYKLGRLCKHTWSDAISVDVGVMSLCFCLQVTSILYSRPRPWGQLIESAEKNELADADDHGGFWLYHQPEQFRSVCRIALLTRAPTMTPSTACGNNYLDLDHDNL